MSKKDPSTNLNGLGEISTIRNILMGQHISEYEDRFSKIDQLVKQMESDLYARLGDLDDQLGGRADAIENEIKKRFGDLEGQLEANIVKLEQRIDSISRSDRQRLGKMLAKVSEQLLED